MKFQIINKHRDKKERMNNWYCNEVLLNGKHNWISDEYLEKLLSVKYGKGQIYLTNDAFWDKYFIYEKDVFEDGKEVFYRKAKPKYKKYKIDNQHTIKDVKKKMFEYRLKHFLFCLVLIAIILLIWYNI